MSRVAVIGGGISGLAAAHRLIELADSRGAATPRRPLRGGPAARRRDPYRVDRRLSRRTGGRFVYHKQAVGDRSVPPARARRPLDLHRSAVSSGAWCCERQAGPGAGRLHADGSGENLAGRRLADFQSAGQAADGTGAVDPVPHGPGRRERGLVRPPAARAARRSTGWFSRSSPAFTRPIPKN